MSTQPGTSLSAGLANTQAAQQFHDGLAIQGAVLPRRTEAFLSQSGRDLDRTVALSGQGSEALTQLGIIASDFKVTRFV